MKTRKYKSGLVFGVFDQLHLGHLKMIGQAKRHTSNLTVVVARDNTVQQLKGRVPKQKQGERLRAVKKIQGVDTAVLGDKNLGTYLVLKKLKPDVIFLGYDQKTFGKHILLYQRLGLLPKIKTIKLKAFKPKKYHSSLLGKK